MLGFQLAPSSEGWPYAYHQKVGWITDDAEQRNYYSAVVRFASCCPSQWRLHCTVEDLTPVDSLDTDGADSAVLELN